MNSMTRDPAALVTMQSSMPAGELALVAAPPTPPAAASLTEEGPQAPTPTVPDTLPPPDTLTPTEKAAISVSGTPTPPAILPPPAPEKAAISVSGTRNALSQTATIIAELQKQDVAAVEAALASVREAYRRGDHSAIEEELIGQGVMLQSVGEALLRLAGSDPGFLQRVQTYTSLALRAFEQARKTLATLGSMRGGPKNQTNVQVNVGAQPHANEILEVPSE